MRLRISSWTLFIIMTVGLIVLLAGQRPELQGPEGEGGPGQVVRIVGHTISWGAAAVLTVRMIRSVRRSQDTVEVKKVEVKKTKRQAPPAKLPQARKV